MKATEIWANFLTQEEVEAIDRGRKELEEKHSKTYQELINAIPKELHNLAENAFVDISTAGECNGFQAGFYYALKMFEELRADCVRYYSKQPEKR